MNGSDSPLDAGERRLRSLIDRLPGAVYRCTYDERWVSLYMGEGFRSICGIDPESLDPAGRSFKDIVMEEDIEKLKTEVADAVENRTYYSVEYRVHTDAFGVRWVEDHGRPSFKEDGSVRWLDGILMDVTDRKNAEKELRELNDTLEEIVASRTRQLRRLSAELAMAEQRERDQFARTVHNDLQQFLYGMQVQTRMLIDSLEENGQIDVGALDVRPQELEKLIDQAIETTRSLTVNLSPPVLEGDGLKETLQWLRTHLKERHDFEVELEGKLPDEPLKQELRMVLFQAIRELLLNACKHSSATEAYVRTSYDADHVQIEVSDEGEGFDVQRESGTEHTGFGLHSVAERIRFFNGTLTVDSQEGVGTRCTLQIPRSPEVNSPLETDASQPEVATD